jgi:hypothetical protein
MSLVVSPSFTFRTEVHCAHIPAKRGIKGRCRPMLGLKSTTSAARFYRCHDELRNFLRCRSWMRQHVPASARRWQHTGQFANYVAWAQYFPHCCRQLQEQGGTVRCRR